MIPPMKFDYLTWEAFATLITGCLAVYAAYRIGVRQTNIVARQTDIQRLALNASLFDKRMVIVDAFAKHKNALTWKPEEIESTRIKMAELSGEVPFLFPAEVMEIYSEAWAHSTKLGSYLTTLRETEDHNKDAIYEQFVKPLSDQYDVINQRFYTAVAPHMTLHAVEWRDRP